MAAVKKLHLDDCILPTFVRRIVDGKKKKTSSKMSTRRLAKLMDMEIEESQGGFKMPQVLEEPTVIHFTHPLSYQFTSSSPRAPCSTVSALILFMILFNCNNCKCKIKIFYYYYFVLLLVFTGRGAFFNSKMHM